MKFENNTRDRECSDYHLPVAINLIKFLFNNVLNSSDGNSMPLKREKISKKGEKVMKRWKKEKKREVKKRMKKEK